jgi:hypothetical protein
MHIPLMLRRRRLARGMLISTVDNMVILRGIPDRVLRSVLATVLIWVLQELSFVERNTGSHSGQIENLAGDAPFGRAACAVT